MRDFRSSSGTFIYKLGFYFALKAKVHYCLCNKDLARDVRVTTLPL